MRGGSCVVSKGFTPRRLIEKEVREWRTETGCISG